MRSGVVRCVRCDMCIGCDRCVQFRQVCRVWRGGVSDVLDSQGQALRCHGPWCEANGKADRKQLLKEIPGQTLACLGLDLGFLGFNLVGRSHRERKATLGKARGVRNASQLCSRRCCFPNSTRKCILTSCQNKNKNEICQLGCWSLAELSLVSFHC